MAFIRKEMLTISGLPQISWPLTLWKSHGNLLGKTYLNSYEYLLNDKLADRNIFLKRKWADNWMGEWKSNIPKIRKTDSLIISISLKIYRVNPHWLVLQTNNGEHFSKVEFLHIFFLRLIFTSAVILSFFHLPVQL